MSAQGEPSVELLTAPVTAGRPRRKGRRRHLRFTREGKVFVLVTFGLGVAALNTGNNLMYLSMGFMLSLIILSGILSELAIQGIRARRTLPVRSFVGEPILVELDVYNEKERLPSYSIEVEDCAAGEATGRSCYLLKVEPDAMRSVTYRRTPRQRGELHFESVRVGTRYPFSLFHKWRFDPSPESLLVYPARLPWDVEAETGYQEGEQGGHAAGRGAETRGLRDYRDRDEMRRIHWKRSATLGKTVVREMEAEASQVVSLVVDNACPLGDADFESRFESVISRAAYAAEVLVGRGASVEVVARGERSALLAPGSHVDPVWRFLACLRAVDAATAPPVAAGQSRAVRVVVPPMEGA